MADHPNTHHPSINFVDELFTLGSVRECRRVFFSNVFKKFIHDRSLDRRRKYLVHDAFGEYVRRT